jgi:hypothetical protein
MTKKLTAILLTLTMLCTFVTGTSALDVKRLDTMDALTALKAAMGLITPTEYQIQIYDMDGDGKITTNDVLLILRIAVSLPAVEEPFIPQAKALPESVDLQLRNSYITHENLTWSSKTADELEIMQYFGTFNGFEAVVIFPKEYCMTMEMQYIQIAEYTIALSSGSLELLVHDNGAFVPIREAYERGMLTENDIKIIAEGGASG